MAVILVAGIGAWATAGTTGVTAGVLAAVTTAAAIGAAYLDSRYIYPALFGKDNPRNPTVLGLDTMTGEDGAPGHKAWGRSALVGGHCLFFEDLQTSENRTSSKKGGGVTFTKRTATVGIGWARNRIADIRSIFADQKTFWRGDPNTVLWTDYRLTFTTAASGTRIALTPQVGDAQDFAQIFVVGNVVKLRCGTAALNGYWRVAAVYGVGSSGSYPNGRLELTPLQGQTPAAGDPGTSYDPMSLVRLDAGIIDGGSGIDFQPPRVGSGMLNSPPYSYTGPEMRFFVQHPGPDGTVQYSHFWYRLRNLLRVGALVMAENWLTSNGTMEPVDGLWTVVSVTNFGLVDQIRLRNNSGRNYRFFSLSSQDIPTHPDPVTNPGRLLLYGQEGFTDVVANQRMRTYYGTEAEGPDQDLLPIYGTGNVHGYRGLARSTIVDMNLSNFGDRVPQFAAVLDVSGRHTTHDVFRDVMREAYGNDDAYDLTDLAPDPVLGYTRRGLQQSTTTLQPVALAYGIESQDVGGTWRLFKASQAHVHQLEENELGAHVSSDKDQGPFQHQRVQDRELPRRLALYYRDPTNDYQRSEKLARVPTPTAQEGDDVAVDVDPLVMYPWDAQNAVNRIYYQTVVGRDQGTITLPPSRIDILPNDRVTFTALNWDDEEVELDGGNIDHVLQIKDVEPGSVSIEVEFTNSGGCRLIDDGEGNITGFPSDVTPTTATVDYETGEVVVETDDPILSARVRYEFPNAWRMRVQGIKRYRNRVMELSLVSVAEKFPVVGSPVQPNNVELPVVIRPAVLTTHVLDIPGIIEDTIQRPGVFFAAAPNPGSVWRGAVVYQSTDNVDYSPVCPIQQPTTMGVVRDELAAPTTENVVDWVNTLTVELAHGALADATLDQIGEGYGQNWALVGDEVVAFQRAELNEDGSYTLSGLVRGLRDTADAMGTHVAGERFVLLTWLGIDFYSGALYEFPRPTDIGRTVWIKIVPAGGVLDDYPATQVTWRAANVRPFAPALIKQGSLADYGYDSTIDTYGDADWLVDDVVVRWWRRSRSLSAAFGAGSTAPLLEDFERYLVTIRHNGTVIRTVLVGGQNTGSTMVHRTFRYTLAEQTADGLVGGDTVAFEIAQVGKVLGRETSIQWTLP